MHDRLKDEETSPFGEIGRGVRACVPVCISVGAYGLVWGVLAGQAGLSPFEVLAMSGFVFAGSSQFVALDLWSSNAAALPIGAIVLAVVIVNLRYVLLTATLRPLFAHAARPGALALMFLVTDENWAITVGEMNKGRATPLFLLGGGLAIWSVWLASTVVGRLAGSAIDDPTTYGLDFAFTATFLALLLGMWRGRGDIVPWLVAGLSAIFAAQMIDSNWSILIGGLVGSLAGALVEIWRQRR